jgi:hypothetical protein
MLRYIYSILEGKTKPNVVGWLLYEIASICILMGAYELYSDGDKEMITTIYLALVFSVTQLIVIILAFRRGFVRLSGLE